MFRGAALKTQSEYWKEIISNRTVVDWIENGVSIPFISGAPQESVYLRNRHFSAKETVFIRSEIKQLCEQKVIVKCSNVPFWVSPINVVPKSDDSYRLILDLRKLNTVCGPSQFVYEDINSVISVIRHKDKLVTLDLKNGFYHIPVQERDWDYLGFQFEGVYYKFCVLPFGANFSPYYFCKTIRSVVQYLRQHNLHIVAYVDDFLISDNEHLIYESRDFVIDVLKKLGWFINFKKSDLEPTHSKKFIGFVIDTNTCHNSVILKVPKDRIQKLKHDIKRLKLKGQASARFIARLCGQCVSMTKAILPAKLMLRNLYRLLSTKASWQDVLTLDEASANDLDWWYDSLVAWNGRAYSSRQSNKPVVQIATDASQTGYGGTILHTKYSAQGFWPNSIATRCSNYREILAVYLTLVSFKEIVKGHTVQILSDNVATVSYLVCMGGPSRQLSEIASNIWGFAIQNNISLSAKYLQGIQNKVADGLSRLASSYEWKLHTRIFQYLNIKWGPFSVDRFANMSNTQLARYNSLFLDPMTMGVDAFSQCWSGENNYLNPPIRLMNRVLDKIIADRAVATLICPIWPAQSWFTKLLKISVCTPLKLPKSHLICIPLSNRLPEPMKNPRWRLFAWRVNGGII